MTYEECFHRGRTALERAGIDEAALDARLLLEHVCQTNRNDLLVHGNRELSEEQIKEYENLIAGRRERRPLQHLTGEQEFMGIKFQVNEHVLIPRQDTEILVEEVLRELSDGSRILDMCTGSGCILISLLHYSNRCRGIGVDISEEAIKIAKQNAVKCGLRLQEPYGAWGAEEEWGLCRESEVGFLCSDLFFSVKGEYEVIVSNPPYIATAVLETLMPEVRDHEPRQALDGHEDGLFFYQKIIFGSKRHLVGGGKLYFEIGYDQGEAVSDLMRQNGFTHVRTVKDYGGLDRVVSGILEGKNRS
nr:peptide chain release factor N(5)-glutamine methyltransferase [uncultured Acetatifactor sp.]